MVLDEIETLQRVRGDVREKVLNALRQLLDEIDTGRFPGLFLVITGTPAFYDGQQGVQRLPPLAQRLATDFTTDPRFDSPRAVQLRLPGFDPRCPFTASPNPAGTWTAPDLPAARRLIAASGSRGSTVTVWVAPRRASADSSTGPPMPPGIQRAV